MSIKDVINLYHFQAKMSVNKYAFLVEKCKQHDIETTEDIVKDILETEAEKNRIRLMNIPNIFGVPFSF